jgi:hypothetical protein
MLKPGLYFRTIKHLKPVQIRYRLWYLFRDWFRKLINHSRPFFLAREAFNLNFAPFIPKYSSFSIETSTSFSFTFLNKSHAFNEPIDWNFNNYGKLWMYNLNYFDYLLQNDINKEDGLALIRDFIRQIKNNREGLEPYPVSLRGMNWIKFLSRNNIKDNKINASLYAQYQLLLDNVEYHLLGNHLLENGCSLFFGAFYFKDPEFLKTARDILVNQLDEQILADGGHFERSTMYHCIMLERLLDCYNLLINNKWNDNTELEEKLGEKTKLMLGWVDLMTVDQRQKTVSGRPSAVKGLPLLNDAAKGIAASTSAIKIYANSLGILPKKVRLWESGYHRYKAGPFEIICDAGNIGPDYNPGHAHCDTFSFVLYHEGRPIIIDPGISTYENNEQRQMERSTAFHNTVQLDDKEQSETWGTFRVGRRAKVHDVEEQIDDNRNIWLSAWHDGFMKWGVKHKRSWIIEAARNRIIIRDHLIGSQKNNGWLRFHFHHSWNGKIASENQMIKLGNVKISFDRRRPLEIKTFNCPNGYHSYFKSHKVEVPFVNSISIFIEL